MDILQLAKDALAFFQQIEPGVTAAAKVGATLGTMGTAAVQVLQKGQQLVTYLIQRAKKPAPADSPEMLAAQPIATKADVAILVDINRRMLQDAARFLDEKKIDADIIIVTNDPEYSDKIKFIDPNNPAEWESLVKEFTTAMNAIKRAVGGARIHIFLSTTLAQAFAFGAVWGTVDEATVYHWEKQTYYPAMRISRGLR